jgi:hypothetical protein
VAAIDLQYDSRGNRTGFFYMDLLLLGYGRDDGQRSVVVFARPTAVLFGGIYTPTSSFGLTVACSGPGCIDPSPVRLTAAEWLVGSSSRRATRNLPHLCRRRRSPTRRRAA